jgi:predicted nucleic acid-binding protein
VTDPTAIESILIDSSGWLEYITEDTKAELFSPYFVSDSRNIVISPIVIYEVRKVLLRRSKRVAEDFDSQVERYELIPLDGRIAHEAASLSTEHHLHIADALIYATALVTRAQLITSDNHFNNLPQVMVL